VQEEEALCHKVGAEEVSLLLAEEPILAALLLMLAEGVKLEEGLL